MTGTNKEETSNNETVATTTKETSSNSDPPTSDTNKEETSNNETVATATKETSSNSDPRTSLSEKDLDVATEALNHFAQGKRHLLVHDIQSAVNALQDACRLLAEHYGETASECADAYFYYGKSLLELARIENGVLGNALDGEETSTEDEDSEDKEGDSQDGEDEAGEDEAEPAQENGEESDEPEGEKTEESEEEDVSNLQLSWEMLELAKVIYTKQLESNPAMNLKIAQVYLKLGEVGLESENYSQSIADFQQCLTIQVKELSSDDRCLAETHYQMGVAYSFSDDFEKAIQSFSAAAKVIEDRMTNLEKQQKEKLSWTEEQRMKDAQERKDPFYTEQAEIDELSKLLPEIKERIVDMEEMKKDSKEKLQKIREATFASVLGGSKPSGATAESTSIGFSDAKETTSAKPETAKPAMNITHLIRKKRKPEEEADKDDAKKAKGENGEEMKLSSVNGKKMENGASATEEIPMEVKVKELPESSSVEVSENKAEKASS